MKPQDISYFIAGLKHTIQSSPMTQEEFAHGVTSKVNLSNVLRETSGTSQKMRVALAAKAGLTVDDLVMLGKELQRDLPQQELRMHPPEVDTLSNPLELSDADLITEISQRKYTALNSVQETIQKCMDIIRTLLSEKNKLVSLLARDQSVINGVTTNIFIVTADKHITFCNRAATERFTVFPGDTMKKLGLCHCDDAACVINNALHTGNRATQLFKVNGEFLECTAHPMMDPSGVYDRVVLTIRDITDAISLYLEKDYVSMSKK